MKAYRATVDNLILEDPHHFEKPVIYAEKASEAKSKVMKFLKGYSVKDYINGDYRDNYSREIKYTDIRVKRVKSLDKVSYGGKLLTVEEVRQLKWVEERDAKAKKLADKYPDEIAVVWAGCYGAYWGANRAGYFSSIESAGKYTTKEAYDIVKGNDYSRQEIVELLNVEEYNKKIQEKINELEKLKIVMTK